MNQHLGFKQGLSIASIVLLMDQLSKWIVVGRFTEGEVLPLTSFFNLVLVYNPGAAFSFLAAAGGWQRWFFVGLGSIAAMVLVVMLRRQDAHASKWHSLALSMILGGAVGNVIDRLLYGRVVDFLDFFIQTWHWPAFNIADCGITVGAVLLVLDELRHSK
jgi:signal peptidase II